MLGDEDLRELVRDLTEDQIATLVETLPPDAADLLLQELSGAVTHRMPLTPLAQAQALMDFSERAHLAHISQRIAQAVEDVENGHSRQLIVELPPRMGKTTLTTLVTPSWIMAKHPNWPVALTSHDGSLATSWGRQIRRWVEGGKLGAHLKIAPDAGAVGNWETTQGGKLLSLSTRESFTGRGAKVLVIDDPHKDFVDAHSATMRDNVWNWWLSVAQLRLEPPYLVIVVMCMTGDTPVLRPDGSTTPLAEIRPGDEIATYEDGKLATSTVLNWANQGPDSVYCMRMKSGRTVRANARHPFLTVDEDEVETWERLGSLKAGMKVRSVEEPTQESNAQARGANSPRSVRACACGTTTLPDGRPATVPLHLTQRATVESDSSSDTGSPPKNTICASQTREDAAPSVEDYPKRLPGPNIGLRSSASITTTTQEQCAACSATTATLSSPEATPPEFFESPLTTWSMSVDEIVEISFDSIEDVFDLQVERTENFIANGLTAHNTRWHEDDLVGRLLSTEKEGDPADWEVITIPAIAEENDALGRAPGEPMISPLLANEQPAEALTRWQRVKRSVGSYVWSSMFQQHPSPAQGSIFKADAWRYWTHDPSKATDDGRVRYITPAELKTGTWLDSWDFAFKGDKTASDYVVGQRWAKVDANRYLVAQKRSRMTFTATLAAVEDWASPQSPFGDQVHLRLVEDAANGPAIMDVLKDKIAGMKAIQARVSKQARAYAVTPEIESGNVYLPHPSDPGNEWVADLLSELRNFPHDVHDDQCFIAGTLVETIRGDVPIEHVHPGDVVKGEHGWTLVTEAGMTSPAAPVVSKIGLTGTRNHPVWTSRGWVPLAEIVQGDTVQVSVPSVDSGRSSLGDGASPVTSVGGSCQSLGRILHHPLGDGYLEAARGVDKNALCNRDRDGAGSVGYGEARPELRKSKGTGSRSVAILTRIIRHIGTTTEQAQGPQWTHSTGRLTNESTGLSPTAGTYITLTPTQPTMTRVTSSRLHQVSIAESPCLFGKSGEGLGWTVRQCWNIWAKSVHSRWLPKSRNTKLAAVYNLTTEDGTYFANGVLVHNCDALTQALTELRTQRPGHVTVPKGQPQTDRALSRPRRTVGQRAHTDIRRRGATR